MVFVTVQRTVYYTNGDKYTGDWVDGKANGHGVYTFGPNGKFAGDRYEGQFKDGKYHGKGTY